MFQFLIGTVLQKLNEIYKIMGSNVSIPYRYGITPILKIEILIVQCQKSFNSL